MPTFFNVLGHLEGTGVEYSPRDIKYMNWRYHHIVEPIKDTLPGATVLDLGSHDGRWPYAFAAAGATVLGIEGRADVIAQFSRFPDADVKSRVTIIDGDFVVEMDRLITEGKRFDVVSCLGVYYHTMQHYRMLMQMVAFRPKVIVVDSLFHLSDTSMILVDRENTAPRLASIAQQEGQTWVPVGRMSRPAFELMAESVGYTVEWVRWDVPEEDRKAMAIYFGENPRQPDRQRFTCLLRPA